MYPTPSFSRVVASAILSLLAFLQGACSRAHYTVSLEKGERVTRNAVVLLDGRPVGRVSSVTDETPRRADIVITERLYRRGLPQGVERVVGDGIRLFSDPAGSNGVLPPGSVIATRSRFRHLSDRTTGLFEDGLWIGMDAAREHPLATAGLAALAIGLVIGLLRTRSRASLVLLFLLGTGFVASSRGGVKAADLDARLKLGESWLASADIEAAQARRLITAGLGRDAEESGVRVLLLCDRIVELEAAVAADVPHLRVFTGAGVGEGLRQRVTALGERRGQLQDQMAEVAATGAGAGRLLRLYWKQRDRIVSKCRRDGIYDPVAVIARLTELAQFPRHLVDEALLVHWDNVHLCRLQGDRVLLPDGSVLALKDDSERADRAEKEVVRLASEFAALKASRPAAVEASARESGLLVAQLDSSNEIVATRAITAVVTPPPPALVAPNSATEAVVLEPTGIAAKGIRQTWLVGALAFVTLLVTGAVIWFGHRSKRSTSRIALRLSDQPRAEFDIGPEDELVLDRFPYVGAKGRNDRPAIVLTDGAVVLRVAPGVSTEIDGEPTAEDRELAAGARIAVGGAAGDSEFQYLDIEYVR